MPCVYYFVDGAAGARPQLDTASLALPLVLVTVDNLQPGAWTQVHTRPVQCPFSYQLIELQTNLREDFTITEKAPTTRALSFIAPTSAFAFKNQAKAFSGHSETSRSVV